MDTLRELAVGDKAFFHKTITEADVGLFAGVTGDFSRIHMDAEFARSTQFGQRIAHGLLTSSFISTIMGMQLPGSGTIFMDQSVACKKPVFVGDTITTQGAFTGYAEKTKGDIGEFTGTCTNQRDEVVVTATCHQMMPKTHFKIVDR